MYYRKTTTKSCLQCNQIFHSAISEIKRGNGKFCSLACVYNGRRGKRPGQLQQNIRRKLKANAFNQYGEKCEICGYALSVDVHHLIPKAEAGNDDVDNLAVLCPNHHREFHLGLLTKEDIQNFRKVTVEVESFELSSRDIASKTSTSLVNL